MSPSPRATTAAAAATTWVAVGLWMMTGSLVGATCTEDQRNICRSSVSDGVMSSMAGAAGECQAKQYVHFSHVCTVHNYLPNIEHCCCLINNKTTTGLLCCRYHQSWNYFRCYDTEDFIEKIESSALSAPLEILLPCVLVPTVVFVCLLLCCSIRQCCRSGERRGATFKCCGDCDEDTNKSEMSGDHQRSSCCSCYEECCGYEQSSDIDEFPVVGLRRQNRVPSTVDDVEFERRQRQQQLLGDSVDKAEVDTGNNRRIMCHYGHAETCCFSCRPTAPPYCSPVYTDVEFIPPCTDSVEPSAPPATLATPSSPTECCRHQVEPVNAICHLVRCGDVKPETRSAGNCSCHPPTVAFHPHRPTAVPTTSGWQLVANCDCASRHHCTPNEGDVTAIAPPAYDECVERTGSIYVANVTSYC